jgi:hypothetical protein
VIGTVRARIGSPLAAAALALAAWAAPAAAQVGHPPAQSPYRDIGFKQEITAFTGWYAGGEGSAGVGPTGGPMLGVRYELRIGGPAQLVGRVAGVFSERTVLDPARPEDTRDLGTRSWPIYLADVGLSLNLTGQKSWHGLVPTVHGGLGVASDFGTSGDPGGYEFGTPFAFNLGAGVRWIRGGRLQLRADVTDYLYQLEYPDTYFVPPGNVPPVLTGRGSRGEYTHNLALTVGASYLFFR